MGEESRVRLIVPGHSPEGDIRRTVISLAHNAFFRDSLVLLDEIQPGCALQEIIIKPDQRGRGRFLVNLRFDPHPQVPLCRLNPQSNAVRGSLFRRHRKSPEDCQWQLVVLQCRPASGPPGVWGPMGEPFNNHKDFVQARCFRVIIVHSSGHGMLARLNDDSPEQVGLIDATNWERNALQFDPTTPYVDPVAFPHIWELEYASCCWSKSQIISFCSTLGSVVLSAALAAIPMMVPAQHTTTAERVCSLASAVRPLLPQRRELPRPARFPQVNDQVDDNWRERPCVIGPPAVCFRCGNEPRPRIPHGWIECPTCHGDSVRQGEHFLGCCLRCGNVGAVICPECKGTGLPP